MTLTFNLRLFWKFKLATFWNIYEFILILTIYKIRRIFFLQKLRNQRVIPTLINTKDVSKNGVEFDVLNLFSGRDNRERLVRRMKSILTQNLIYLSKKWNTVFDSKRSLKVAVENFLLAHIKLHSECVTVSQCWAEIFFLQTDLTTYKKYFLWLIIVISIT